MTFQALSLGLAAHQFRAFDKEGVTREFAVPPHWEVSTMTAFGVAPDREPDARDRREMRDLLWPTRERPEAQRLNLEELVGVQRREFGQQQLLQRTALRVTPTRLEAGDSQGIVDGT